MAYDLSSLRIRWAFACGLFLVAALGLAACGGASYPPPSGCAGCADQSASAAARAAVLAGDTRRERAVTGSAAVEEPRTQRALTQGQVASRTVRLPLLPASDGAARERALAGQTARRPQMAAQSGSAGPLGRPVSLIFAPVAERLTLEMKNQLRILALHLRRDDAVRVELQGYASTSDGNATQARHVALSRAMAVRAYLLEQDVDLDQIDVRALGEWVESGSTDRVDIVTAARRG